MVRDSIRSSAANDNLLFKCLSLNEISKLSKTNVIYEKNCGNGNKLPLLTEKRKTLPPVHESRENLYSVVILGELNVGKSSICRSYFFHSNDASNEEECIDDIFEQPDVAKNHHVFERPVFVDDEQKKGRIRIYDVNTAKQFMESKKENGFADMNIYLDVGQACVVTYAITDYSTFEAAKHILKKISHMKSNQEFAVILVANKCDLEKKRQVLKTDGMKLAEKYRVKFIETSAILNKNIEVLFEGTVNQIYLREREKESLRSRKPTELLKDVKEELIMKCWRKMTPSKKVRAKELRCMNLWRM